MPPVDELVHERATFARVGDAPVDEDRVRLQAVDSVQYTGKERAGHVKLRSHVVQRHSHPPITHSWRQRRKRDSLRSPHRVDDACIAVHDATFPCPYGHTDIDSPGARGLNLWEGIGFVDYGWVPEWGVGLWVENSFAPVAGLRLFLFLACDV